MRQCKLIPESDVCLIRDWAPPRPVRSSAIWTPPPADLAEDYGGLYTVRASKKRHCRCCGYPVEEGSIIIDFWYRPICGRAAFKRICIHREPCEYGAAHQIEVVLGRRA